MRWNKGAWLYPEDELGKILGKKSRLGTGFPFFTSRSHQCKACAGQDASPSPRSVLCELEWCCEALSAWSSREDGVDIVLRCVTHRGQGSGVEVKGMTPERAVKPAPEFFHSLSYVISAESGEGLASEVLLLIRRLYTTARRVCICTTNRSSKGALWQLIPMKSHVLLWMLRSLIFIYLIFYYLLLFMEVGWVGTVVKIFMFCLHPSKSGWTFSFQFKSDFSIEQLASYVFIILLCFESWSETNLDDWTSTGIESELSAASKWENDLTTRPTQSRYGSFLVDQSSLVSHSGEKLLLRD